MRRKMAMRPTDRPMKKAIRPGMTRPKRKPAGPTAKAAAALGKKGVAGGIAALKNQAAAKAKPGAKRPKPKLPTGRPTPRPRPRPARRPSRRR